MVFSDGFLGWALLLRQPGPIASSTKNESPPREDGAGFNSTKGGLCDLAEGVDVPLEFALVVRGFVFMDNPFSGEAVEVRLGFAQKLLRLSRIVGLAKLFHHRAHPAAMKAVASAALDILPDPLGG